MLKKKKRKKKGGGGTVSRKTLADSPRCAEKITSQFPKTAQNITIKLIF